MRPPLWCAVTVLILACGWPRSPATSVLAGPSAISTRFAAAPATSHLRPSADGFVDAAGEPFPWRGVSAFRLLEMVAHGRERQAAAYLDWAAAHDVNVVRVLAMAHHLFQLKPEEGAAALPKLLEMAEARGVYVEIVALADTAAIAVDIEQHVKTIGDVAGRHANALVEVANEPVHPTQRAEVHDPEVLRKAAALIPPGVPVSLGSIERGEGFAAGTYLTWHVPRTHEPAGWGHVLAIAEGAALVDRWKKPVVSDEPIGAASRANPGRRDNAPSRFRGAALLTRLAGLGATYHYEGGLQARIPRGRELECFRAWKEAWQLLPPHIERRGEFGRAGEQGSAVAGYAAGAALGVFERRTETEAWVVALGVTRDPAVRPADGWQTASTKPLPGVSVVALRRK